MVLPQPASPRPLCAARWGAGAAAPPRRAAAPRRRGRSCPASTAARRRRTAPPGCRKLAALEHVERLCKQRPPPRCPNGEAFKARSRVQEETPRWARSAPSPADALGVGGLGLAEHRERGDAQHQARAHRRQRDVVRVARGGPPRRGVAAQPLLSGRRKEKDGGEL